MTLEDLRETFGDEGQSFSKDEEDVSSSKAFAAADRLVVCLILGILWILKIGMTKQEDFEFGSERWTRVEYHKMISEIWVSKKSQDLLYRTLYEIIVS